MSFQPQLLSNNFTSIFSAETRNGMASMARTFHKQQEEGKVLPLEAGVLVSREMSVRSEEEG